MHAILLLVFTRNVVIPFMETRFRKWEWDIIKCRNNYADRLYKIPLTVLIKNLHSGEQLIRMKLLYLFLLIVMVQNTSGQTTGQKPCSAPQTSQFDFWVGEWNLSWKDSVRGMN